MDGVVLYRELNADTTETAFQFGINLFQVLRWDIGRVRIEFCQNLGHCFLYEICHVYRIYILIIDNT